MTPTTTSETVDAKARRLLALGRVYVLRTDHEHTVAIVQGDSDTHEITFAHGGWSCTCPAFGECSHLLAVKKVTVAGSNRKAD